MASKFTGLAYDITEKSECEEGETASKTPNFI